MRVLPVVYIGLFKGDNMSFLHHGQYYTLEELVQHLGDLEA
jgi:hypothetical protein